MIIRKWLEKDNLRVSEIEKDSFSDYWSLKMIEGAFSSSNFVGYVAEENGIVVGYILATFCAGEGDINLLAVDKNFRRRNIATNLLTTLISRLKSLNGEKLFLEVRRSNDGAKALYESLGFTYIGVRPNYYQGVEDALMMCKDI